MICAYDNTTLDNWIFASENGDTRKLYDVVLYDSLKK